MAPRKAAANGEASEGPFKWEGPNDNKLLLLTQGRYVKPDEYEQLTQAFPGATTGSIRNRISALRVKQRDMYDSLSWTLPDGGAGHSAKKTPGKKNVTPRKRGVASASASADDAVGAEDGSADAVLETPSKKPRVKRAKQDAPEKSEDGIVSGDGSAGEQAKRSDVKEGIVGEEV